MLLTANELMHRPLRARGWGGDVLAHAGSLAIRRRANYVSTMNVLANNIAGQFQQTSS